MPTTKAQGLSRPRPAAEAKVDIIRTVKTPLAFYVLVVLMVEAIIGVIAGFSAASDRTTIVLVMAAIVTLLVVTVTLLALFKPEALEGRRAPLLVGVSSQASELPTIKGPKILLGATAEFTQPKMGFQHDIEAIRSLPNSGMKIEPDVTSARMREVLIKEKFDIIHFLGFVRQSSGDICFSSNDVLGADGFSELIKMAGARLVILATCDSIALGGRLSHTTNVIAATSSVEVAAFSSWEGCFFDILGQEYPLSQAFEISRRITDAPLVLLMKEDLRFSAQ